MVLATMLAADRAVNVNFLHSPHLTIGRPRAIQLAPARL